MAHTVSHTWNTEEVIYYRKDGKPIVKIGAYSYAGPVIIEDFTPWMHPQQEVALVEIGRFCSMADAHFIMYGNRDYKRISLSSLRLLYEHKDYVECIGPIPKAVTQIGNEVWAGTGVEFLSNVKIGHGAIVGARSLVSKDVPPYAIVAGNPARIKKYRFNENQIEALLKIAWWNWPPEKITENAKLLFSRDIDGFISKYLDSSE